MIEFPCGTGVERTEELADGRASLLVRQSRVVEDGGSLLVCSFVGANVADVTTTLVKSINEDRHRVHLCGGDPCEKGLEEELIHIPMVRWFKVGGFTRDYLPLWGEALLKEVVDSQSAPKRGRAPPPSKPGEGRAKATPKAPARRRTTKPAKEDEVKKREKAGREPTYAALKSKLEELKKRDLGRRKPKETKEIGKDFDLSEAEEEEESSNSSCAVVESHLETGNRMPRMPTALALMDRAAEKDTRGITMRDRSRDREKKSRGGAEAQLLAMAVQRDGAQGGSRQQKRRKKKNKGSKREKDKESKEDRSRKKKDKRKKKRKKKKKRRGDGDSSPSSSEESSESGESSISSSSSLLAPLQKRSRESPGGVLRMLVKHARMVMDQSATVDVGDGGSVTSGVKLTSYFALMLRPYHSSSSRDMKELFGLATCMDLLREGKLGALGDSLASRFIAIQTAMADGSWKAAQYLEMHPLEAPSPAPAPLLLQARRHARLVRKSQDVDDGVRRGNYRTHEWRSSYQQEEKGKGKGKGKDGKGKGKGRGYGGAGGWQQGGYWKGNQNWWEDKRDR